MLAYRKDTTATIGTIEGCYVGIPLDNKSLLATFGEWRRQLVTL
jgi:hypothetical protein